jgi:hypothetical protein
MFLVQVNGRIVPSICWVRTYLHCHEFSIVGEREWVSAPAPAARGIGQVLIALSDVRMPAMLRRSSRIGGVLIMMGCALFSRFPIWLSCASPILLEAPWNRLGRARREQSAQDEE